MQMVPLSGRKVVASAGTAERFAATTTRVASIAVQAEDDNTGDVVIGDSAVDETQATRKGFRLAAGESITVTAGVGPEGGQLDLYHLYLDSAINGDGVNWFALTST